MKLGFALISLCLLIFAPLKSAHANNQAICILLQQQMAQFDHVRQHPNYRRAKRDYDRKCTQAETPVSKTTDAPTATPVEQDTQPTASASVTPQNTDAQETHADSDSSASTDVAQSQSIEPTTSEGEQSSEPQANEDSGATVATVDKDIETQQRESEKTTTPIQHTAQTPVPEQSESFIGWVFPLLIAVAIISIALMVLVAVRSGNKRKSNIGASSEGESSAFVSVNTIGKLMEGLLRKPKELPTSSHQRLSKVPLPSGAQAAEAIMSAYGIFIVSRRDEVGDLYGSLNAQSWTIKEDKEETKLANPLVALNEEISALAKHVDISAEYIHAVISFEEDVEFKSDLPKNVVHDADVAALVLSFNNKVLSTDDLARCHDYFRPDSNLGEGNSTATQSEKPEPALARGESKASEPKPLASSEPKASRKLEEVKAPAEPQVEPAKRTQTPSPLKAVPEPTSDADKDYSNMSDDDFMKFLAEADSRIKNADELSTPKADETASSQAGDDCEINQEADEEIDNTTFIDDETNTSDFDKELAQDLEHALEHEPEQGNKEPKPEETLATQTMDLSPQEHCEDKGEAEAEAESSNKLSKLSNLSLDPDFKPSEEREDIGSGPLDDKKS